MSSRGVFFDRRGNPTPLALALVCGVCVYVYRGSDGTASHATHARAPAVNGKIPLPHHTAGGDDAELQRALRRIPVDPAADARTVIDRRVRRDPLPKAPVVVAIPQPPPPPPLADIVPIPGERPRRVERGPVPDYRPVSLNLQLPDKYLNEPALENREKMFRQYALPLFRLQTETGRDRWGGCLNGTSRGVCGSCAVWWPYFVGQTSALVSACHHLRLQCRIGRCFKYRQRCFCWMAAMITSQRTKIGKQ